MYKHYKVEIFKNTHILVLFYGVDSLFLQWFFIGYWILKTGLDVYPGPFFMPGRAWAKFGATGHKKDFLIGLSGQWTCGQLLLVGVEIIVIREDFLYDLY